MPATVSPSWAYGLQLPQDPRAPGLARQTLRSVLRTHAMGALVETAELLAGELLANAYLYSDGPYALRLRAMGTARLRISVWDSNPYIPPPFGADAVTGTPRADDARGRGLFLVRAFAANWGGYPLSGTGPGQDTGGKLLWVELRA
ncbi:ATP-binding protein [Streptomyces sp. NPDC059193]|uniref:ATP-binding protein n=1 Tax=Streptomyces sp. NPDC059193 TaxID=3346763 RepID=UPI00368CC4BC